jgi:hypothetical protein
LAEKKIATKKEDKSKKKPYQLPELEPGDNTKYINHSMTIMKWKTPDMNSLEAVQERCYDYFNLCAQNDMKPTFAGFALAFGVDRMTMWRWCNNHPESRKLSDSIRDTIKKARDLINAQMEDFMQNGKINPVAGIFLMKNNMNYTDQQEVVLRPENPLGEPKDPEELRRKYLEDVYGADADKIIDAEEAK